MFPANKKIYEKPFSLRGKCTMQLLKNTGCGCLKKIIEEKWCKNNIVQVCYSILFYRAINEENMISANWFFFSQRDHFFRTFYIGNLKIATAVCQFFKYITCATTHN